MKFFTFSTADNTIRLVSNPSLCLNSWGGQIVVGEYIRLYTCSAAPNERWNFNLDGTIRPVSRPDLCFNAYGGHLNAGDPIGLYPCSAAVNEVFITGDIMQAAGNPFPGVYGNPWCWVIGPGMYVGRQYLDLASCSPSPPAATEVFTLYSDYTIRPTSNPSLCLNGLGQGAEPEFDTCSFIPMELWNLKSDGTFQPLSRPDLCLTVGSSPIGVVLYPCASAQFPYWNITTGG